MAIKQYSCTLSRVSLCHNNGETLLWMAKHPKTPIPPPTCLCTSPAVTSPLYHICPDLPGHKVSLNRCNWLPELQPWGTPPSNSCQPTCVKLGIRQFWELEVGRHSCTGSEIKMEVIILISGKINRERVNKVPGTRKKYIYSSPIADSLLAI